MPKTKISEFSSTPANNTDIDSINIAEGCAPSGINDAIRELMAQLKDFQVGSAGDPVTVGGVLTVTAGAVGTPAITTAGDTNTGIFFPAADTIAFAEGGAEIARFDSAANFGLGVTPSAVDSNYRSLQVGHAAYVFAGNNQYASFTEYAANAFFDTGSTYKYKNTGFATKYRQNDGAHLWYTAASGTAGNAISFTQAMTLDASGNLLVGPTSAVSGGGVLQVSKGITFPATQSASSNANTLDDYEEGTWSPVLRNSSGSESVSLGTGQYIKVGQLVFVEINSYNTTITALSSGSGWHLGGLPFSANSNSYATPCIYQGGQIISVFDGSGTLFPLGQPSSSIDYALVTRNTFGGATTFSFRFSFTYRANT